MRLLKTYQFLYDSWYDLFHLFDKWGQGDLQCWRDIRRYEWNHIWGNPPRDSKEAKIARSNAIGMGLIKDDKTN